MLSSRSWARRETMEDAGHNARLRNESPNDKQANQSVVTNPDISNQQVIIEEQSVYGNNWLSRLLTRDQEHGLAV